MNEKVLHILEYEKIMDRLLPFASSAQAKELCRNLKPSTDLVEIRERQAQTRDALSRTYKRGNLSFSGLVDIRPSLKLLEIGSTLDTKELLQIASLLALTEQVQEYGSTEDEDLLSDSLQPLFDSLTPVHSLLFEIRRCIASEDVINDDASAKLKEIRRNKKLTNQSIHSKLASIVNSQSNKGLLQDTIITMRNGRYCIPVKQEYRNSFPGMIHDQSSTGSTLFIEPMSVVQMNNQLKELEIQEITEIDRILTLLSEQAGFEKETLSDNYQLLTQLDFIFARGKFAKSYNGSEPIFNEDGIIEIKQGRHPLLDPATVVPINFHMGNDYNMLIITGPNTGGKTVSLKTVGLFTLMGQAGLHIPAFEGSRLSVFSEVFADIGDEQSIEQSLSTFSSHMTNIVKILEQADYRSLVLFDELCGGTDPQEGAALAISILTYLHERQIPTMATTHYSELKGFALSTDGIENACCEFNINTLTPTYKLLIGIPGKSNAFAISKKLGLSEQIIQHAKDQIDENVQDFESLLSELEKTKLEIEKERAIIDEMKLEAKELQESLKQKKDDIREKREQMIRQAREEAHAIVENAKTMADESIRKFHGWEKQTGKNTNKKMEYERSKLGKEMRDLEGKLSYRGSGKKGSHLPEDFHIGDPVFVHTFSLEGTVKSLPNQKGDLTVEMGLLQSQVNIKDLEILEKPKPAPEKPKRMVGGTKGLKKAAIISPEINLLGKTVDEATAELDKYLDDAYLAGLNQVSVIHGKGTGALRKGIHNYLKRQKHVKSFRLGVFGEGEAGVTIVEFKEN
ncbi:MAG: endonuclease MutS2 [Lachnospiraceae bacterium]|nr:endonuclease MutS2 [Lachnospiraceae bacterium]